MKRSIKVLVLLLVAVFLFAGQSFAVKLKCQVRAYDISGVPEAESKGLNEIIYILANQKEEDNYNNKIKQVVLIPIGGVYVQAIFNGTVTDHGTTNLKGIVDIEVPIEKTTTADNIEFEAFKKSVESIDDVAYVSRWDKSYDPTFVEENKDQLDIIFFMRNYVPTDTTPTTTTTTTRTTTTTITPTTPAPTTTTITGDTTTTTISTTAPSGFDEAGKRRIKRYLPKPFKLKP